MTAHYLIGTHVEPRTAYDGGTGSLQLCSEISSRTAFQSVAIITHCCWYYFNLISVFLSSSARVSPWRQSRVREHAPMAARSSTRSGDEWLWPRSWNAVSRIDVIGWFFGRSQFGHEQPRQHLISNTLRLLPGQTVFPLNWSRFLRIREIL